MKAYAKVIVSFLLASCGGTSVTPRPTPFVPPAVTNRGEPVYVGRVYPLGDAAAAQPTYVYERRVETSGSAVVSTHVTRDRAGTIQLAEAAEHGPDYSLTQYTLYANQLGQQGTIRVDRASGRVLFSVRDDEGERTNVERLVEPQQAHVVVGPTLVGHVIRRLDALESGRVESVRLAILDRMETIGFDLTAVPAPPGLVRVKMSPTSFWVSLAVEPVMFTFDRATKNLVRLEGRVPTKLRKGNRWADFDARVEYELVAAAYR